MSLAETRPPGTSAGTFEIRLDNFTGPFDLLLSLITKHELDVTEVALAAVTDEFVAYIRDHPEWDLGTASEFLVIAATLLDLKAARLLPGQVTEDLEDLELLEARDLLFARLLQYRAYKEVSALFAERLATEGRRVPRIVPLEPEQSALLPELEWTLTTEEFVKLAARALAAKPPPVVSLTHLHGSVVSVREQAALVVGQLRRDGVATFRALSRGQERLVMVARFLALLELFRSGQVAFEQAQALGELTIRWTGADDDGDETIAQFEEFDATSSAR
ncbi:MAG: segregation/condensation protein A [Promicromonosporaceae bacterium]|nr:segregation/condensation protein A [Promicromonosporaceae bacterium]